jgi:ubiquitin-protein ligase
MAASSPRLRRLQSDLRALQQLQSESSIFHFTAHGDPAEAYTIWFIGRGMMRHENSGPIELQERHEVQIRLGAGYPRMMPEIRWKSPIFHPNISANGSVCLGGYGTYWVPSLTLDELSHMLWDMIRYENYDETSPYNREAALWAKTQSQYVLPLDKRPLRDRLAGIAAVEEFQPKSNAREKVYPRETPGGGRWGYSPTATGSLPGVPTPSSAPRAAPPVPVRPARTAPDDGGVIFLDAEVVQAEPVRPASDADIMFIQ